MLLEKENRIIVFKLVLEEETINILSVYASQVRLHEATKIKFLEDLDEVIQRIPREEKIFIGGDFNEHVEKKN